MNVNHLLRKWDNMGSLCRIDTMMLLGSPIFQRVINATVDISNIAT